MPRQARLDAPGLVHHVVARGIERRDVFADDGDRLFFLDRLGSLLGDCEVPCYAWALMENHVHLVLRSAAYPLGRFMQRLLTAYALHFNRRHDRPGHLFQNRYRSTVVRDDSYLCSAVCYVHLNPIRAGTVKSLAQLSQHPYTGHAVLLGRRSLAWQDTSFVLQVLGGVDGYLKRLEDMLEEGGSLSRPVDAADAPSLPSASTDACHFTDRVTPPADAARLIDFVCDRFGVEVEELLSTSRARQVSQARSAAVALGRRAGLTGVEIARELGITRSGVARAGARAAGLEERLLRGWGQGTHG
ncbi:MAG: transposase [Actinobacteria bacterium]|nr:MAG: transposase [Actinomycetota bacterium]